MLELGMGETRHKAKGLEGRQTICFQRYAKRLPQRRSMALQHRTLFKPQRQPAHLTCSAVQLMRLPRPRAAEATPQDKEATPQEEDERPQGRRCTKSWLKKLNLAALRERVREGSAAPRLAKISNRNAVRT